MITDNRRREQIHLSMGQLPLAERPQQYWRAPASRSDDASRAISAFQMRLGDLRRLSTPRASGCGISHQWHQRTRDSTTTTTAAPTDDSLYPHPPTHSPPSSVHPSRGGLYLLASFYTPIHPRWIKRHAQSSPALTSRVQTRFHGSNDSSRRPKATYRSSIPRCPLDS